MIIELLSLEQARAIFDEAHPARQIITQSPDYVTADALRDTELEPVFIGGRDACGTWLHGAHLSRIPETDAFDLQSAYGYGGPIDLLADETTRGRAWAAYGEVCRKLGVVAEFVRFHPLDSSAERYGGARRADRACVVMSLGEGDLRQAYDVRARTAVRKAEKKGAVVVELPREEIAERFAAFYREGMRLIGADAFYLFNDAYFEALSKLEAIRLLACELEGEWLAAGLFLTGPLIWEYHLSASTKRGRSMSATNLLIDAAARLGRDAGARQLYLGGGTNSAPDNPLLFFKSGFAPATLTFHVGSTIHMPESYEALRTRWPERARSGRVLFYRA